MLTATGLENSMLCSLPLIGLPQSRRLLSGGVSIKVGAEAINVIHWLPNPSQAELRAKDHEGNEPWLVRMLVRSPKGGRLHEMLSGLPLRAGILLSMVGGG